MADPHVTLKFFANATALEAELVRVSKQVESLRAKQGALRKVGGRGEWVNELASVAAQYVSVAAAVGLVTAAIREMDAARLASADRLKAAEFDLARLSEVSKDEKGRFSQELLDQNIAEAHALRAAGVGATLGEAARVQFDLVSAGREGDRDTLVKLGRAGLAGNVAELMGAAATFRTALGPDRAGPLDLLLARAMGAARPTKLSGTEILEKAGGAAQGARALGFGPEDVLASVSVLGEAFGSVETGADRAKQLFAGLEESIAKGFLPKGKTLPDLLAAIRAKDLDYNELKELLGGRIQAVEAFRVLSEGAPEKFATARGEAFAARPSDIDEMVRIAEGNPLLAAARVRRTGEAGAEVAMTDEAVRRSLVEAIKEDVTKYYRTGERGKRLKSELDLFSELLSIRALSLMPGGEEAVLGLAQLRPEMLSPETKAALLNRETRETEEGGGGGVKEFMKDRLRSIPFAKYHPVLRWLYGLGDPPKGDAGTVDNKALSYLERIELNTRSKRDRDAHTE